VAAVEMRHLETTDGEPYAFMHTVPENAIQLPFLRKALHLVHLVGDLWPTEVVHVVARISISSRSTRYPGRKDYDVPFELRPIHELEPLKALNCAPALEFNIVIDDVFARASIDVVPSSSREQKMDEACPIWSEISLEPCFGETI